jgi:hypothetical protein
MVACDFFTVDTVLLRRLYVLVFICVGSRRIEYVACTSNPDGTWMLQQARNLRMALDDSGREPRFLIHDRDAKFTHAFDAIFRAEGVRVIRTPVRAPNANAHMERWVGSVRRECLDRLLIFNRRQTRAHPERLCPPLQRAEATPRTRSSLTRPVAATAWKPAAHNHPPTRHPRRDHPRIRNRSRMTALCTPRADDGHGHVLVTLRLASGDAPRHRFTMLVELGRAPYEILSYTVL